jgi:hypothetical protein
MLACRVRLKAFTGLVLVASLVSAEAQDARTPSSITPAADATRATSEPPIKRANPFPDGSKSGQPCEFFGPCGKCDCPATAGAQGPAEKRLNAGP